MALPCISHMIICSLVSSSVKWEEKSPLTDLSRGVLMLSYMNESGEVKARICDDMEWSIHSLPISGDNIWLMLGRFAT